VEQATGAPATAEPKTMSFGTALKPSDALTPYGQYGARLLRVHALFVGTGPRDL
jgi:hypothetical protein